MEEQTAYIFDLINCAITGVMVFGVFLVPKVIISILSGILVICFHAWRSYVYDALLGDK